MHLMGNDFYDVTGGFCYSTAVDTPEADISDMPDTLALRGAVIMQFIAYGGTQTVISTREVPAKKRKKYRGHASVHKWRLAVLARDQYTCQSCGSKHNLQVHHHSKFSDIDITAHSFVFNGVTLCSECHAQRHPELTDGMLRGIHKYVVNPSLW